MNRRGTFAAGNVDAVVVIVSVDFDALVVNAGREDEEERMPRRVVVDVAQEPPRRARRAAMEDMVMVLGSGLCISVLATL